MDRLGGGSLGALSMVQIRVDSAILPVGAVWRSELEQHEEELVQRLRLQSKGQETTDRYALVANVLKKVLTYEFQIVPTGPKLSTSLGLFLCFVASELLRWLFGLASSGNALTALFIGCVASQGLRLNKRPLVLAALTLGRLAGLHSVLLPVVWLASCFALQRPTDQAPKVDLPPPPIFRGRAWGGLVSTSDKGDKKKR